MEFPNVRLKLAVPRMKLAACPTEARYTSDGSLPCARGTPTSRRKNLVAHPLEVCRL
jgi:hypothetical protein